MTRIAFISQRGRMLMLPAATPYELQVLFDEVEWSARRERAAFLELGAERWLVSIAEDGAQICSHCHGKVTRIRYLTRGHVAFCGPCGRRALCLRNGLSLPPPRSAFDERATTGDKFATAG